MTPKVTERQMMNIAVQIKQSIETTIAHGTAIINFETFSDLSFHYLSFQSMCVCRLVARLTGSRRLVYRTKET